MIDPQKEYKRGTGRIVDNSLSLRIQEEHELEDHDDHHKRAFATEPITPKGRTPMSSQ